MAGPVLDARVIAVDKPGKNPSCPPGAYLYYNRTRRTDYALHVTIHFIKIHQEKIIKGDRALRTMGGGCSFK